MAKRKTSLTSGASLRARREALHLTQGDIHRRTNGLIKQQHISLIELDEVVGGDTKARYVAFLENMEGLQPENVSDMTTSSQEASQRADARGAYDLPFFRPRLAEGGVMAIAAEADHQIKRPEFLSKNGKLYAIEMLGDSMFPRYEDGDTLYVDQGVKPQIGKPCVFLTADRRRIQVRFLEGQADGMWLVRQLTPAVDARLPVEEWPHCEAIESSHSPHRK